MNTITRIVVYLIIALSLATAQGQDKELDSIRQGSKEYKIKLLEDSKIQVEENEKNALKIRITEINKRLDNDEITASEAEDLKREAAKKTALNIENRIAILDNRIELLKRNDFDITSENRNASLSVGSNGLYINLGNNNKPPKYDIRTSNDLLFAIGFNNALIDGQSLDDSPYKLGGSGFVELGWNWKTRVFENSNFLRLKYGFSFQWNKFDIKDDRYFVQSEGVTTLEEFPVALKKAKFRVTNLVFPVHFEFGPSKKRDFTDRIRYTTDDQLKMGIGGYGGFRLGSQQKLKFQENGKSVKQKTRRDFNTSNFVYGLSGYIGFGDVSLYAKYDLSPLFKDKAVDQNNISLGLRLDLD